MAIAEEPLRCADIDSHFGRLSDMECSAGIVMRFDSGIYRAKYGRASLRAPYRVRAIRRRVFKPMP